MKRWPFRLSSDGRKASRSNARGVSPLARHPDKQRKSTYKWRQKNAKLGMPISADGVSGIRSMFGVQLDEGIYRSGEIQLICAHLTAEGAGGTLILSRSELVQALPRKESEKVRAYRRKWMRKWYAAPRQGEASTTPERSETPTNGARTTEKFTGQSYDQIRINTHENLLAEGLGRIKIR